jgi:hypothetical protein
MGNPNVAVVRIPPQLQWLRHESELVILAQHLYKTTQVIAVTQNERLHRDGIVQMLYSTAKRKLLSKPWQKSVQLHPNKGCSREVSQTDQTNSSVHDRSTDEICNGDMSFLRVPPRLSGTSNRWNQQQYLSVHRWCQWQHTVAYRGGVWGVQPPPPTSEGGAISECRGN